MRGEKHHGANPQIITHHIFFSNARISGGAVPRLLPKSPFRRCRLPPHGGASPAVIENLIVEDDLIMGRIEEKLVNLAHHEHVQKIFLLDRELNEADGELTPTMKVKRNVFSEKFKDELNALYVD